MDSGLKFVFSRLTDLQILRLEEYPGDNDLGIQIGQLQNLKELYLSGSTMANDQVMKAVAEGCKKLEILDLSVANGHPECSRHGMLTDEGLLELAYHLPGIKQLNLERRSCISDEGVAAILSNGHIENLALAGSDLITDVTLEALSAYCSDRLSHLQLTQLKNVSSWAILNLSKRWFDNCTELSGYNLQLHLEEMDFDFEDFMHVFEPVTKDSMHEFSMPAEAGRPRRAINVYCDLLITMYSC